MSSQAGDTRSPESTFRVASVQLPVASHDRLRAIAESEHRTLSGELRRLVDRRIAEVDAITDRAAA